MKPPRLTLKSLAETVAAQGEVFGRSVEAEKNARHSLTHELAERIRMLEIASGCLLEEQAYPGATVWRVGDDGHTFTRGVIIETDKTRNLVSVRWQNEADYFPHQRFARAKLYPTFEAAQKHAAKSGCPCCGR